MKNVSPVRRSTGLADLLLWLFSGKWKSVQNFMQELSWLAGYDEDSSSRKRSLLSVASETVLLALHRPVAV